MTPEMRKSFGIEVYRIESANQKEAEPFVGRVVKRVKQLQGKIENPHPNFDPIERARTLSDLLYEPNLATQTKAGAQAVFSELTKEYFFATDDYDSALLVLKTGLEMLTSPLDKQGVEAFELKLNTAFEQLKDTEGQALVFSFDLKPTENPNEKEIELVAIGIPEDLVNLTSVPNLVSIEQ